MDFQNLDPNISSAGVANDGADGRATGYREPTGAAAPIASTSFVVAPRPLIGRYRVRLDARTIVSTTFRLWREDLGRLTGLAALPYAVFVLALLGIGSGACLAFMTSPGEGPFSYSMSPHSFEGPSALLLTVVGASGGLALLAMFLGLVSMAATFLAADESLRGEPRSSGVWSSFLLGFPSLGGLTLAALAIFAVVVGNLMLAFLVLNRFSLHGNLGPQLAFFAVGGIISVLLVLRLVVVAPVIVLEELGVRAAFRRSFELTRGHMHQVLGAVALFILTLVGIQLATTMLGIVPIFGLLASLVAALLWAPLWPLFFVVVYAALVGDPSTR